MNILKSVFKFITILVLIPLSGCTTVDYVGKTYPSSQNVEVYYSFKDVKVKNIVFGHINISPGGFQESETVLKNEAIKRGADAIVITQIEREEWKDGTRENVKASLLKYLEK